MTTPGPVPVILCGGSGTRLWPLSRLERPKQFHSLAGSRSLLQETVLRAARLTDGPPLLVTGAAHAGMVEDQLAAIGIEPVGIIAEPAARNTAPAIGIAAHFLGALGSDAPMWVMPSDHIIGATDALGAAVATAAEAACAGYLAAFGIPPTAPNTGYGYVRAGGPVDRIANARMVDAFLEKPDRTTAEAFLADGGYFWNSGMFVFTPDAYLAELARQAPEVDDAVAAAWSSGRADGPRFTPDAHGFVKAPSISIDYAVMEKTDRAVVVPLDAAWSDVGSWATIWDLQEKDEAGNALMTPAMVHDSRRCYARAGKLVALVGVEDLVVVEGEDAILVCHRDRAEQVKLVAGDRPVVYPLRATGE